ncbi:LppU/SCO3897 family protein [Streptomyces hiroshimensis]|uniref:Uncharacterized protein n=1 Tax=Streptomyces hiroshimensis TaxID=66424 RepID=A0ABQ2Y9N2_9ACTN|nr:hypothetical protein [Streptomyces hiroshimensis]GGX76276.1 hypothetical protein GCM10010324_22410 [Streptomyces hiroshimensis]
MSAEVTVSLSPREASSGVIRPVDLPWGTVRVRIPPVPGGGLIRIGTPRGDVLIRVVVTARPGRLAPKLVGLAAVAAVVAGIVVLSDRNDRSSSADAPLPAPSSYDSSGPSRLGGPVGETPSGSPTPHGAGVATPRRSLPPLEPPAPARPHELGTCLDGESVPPSAGTVTVDPFRVVSCSSAKAHYRVIETFHGTTDRSKCKSVAESQYAYSSWSSRGGRTLWEVVYCLVGLGSYAR